MKKSLFQPFDLNKWIRVGFTAWLAGLTDCNGGGGSGGNHSGINGSNWDEFFHFPETAWNWLQSHPLYFNLIIIGVILLFIVVSVFIWLSSRGKFMFLHNVANDRSEISKAWSEFRKEGNSLFLWRLFFGWLAIFLFVIFLVYCFISAKEMYYGDFTGMELFRRIAGLVLIFIAFMIIAVYISLFLNDFVVPVMYKHRLSATKGWLKFLPLFGRYSFAFIVYGLFIFVLEIAVAIGVIIAGLITCCIGLLLLAIPFVGAVILLPVSYTFRALSIEFLAQFGDEFNVFPKPGEPKDVLPV